MREEFFEKEKEVKIKLVCGAGETAGWFKALVDLKNQY